MEKMRNDGWAAIARPVAHSTLRTPTGLTVGFPPLAMLCLAVAKNLLEEHRCRKYDGAKVPC